ncbi:4Fe-4S binding protein [Methanoculleus sp. FWC-SCC1]|uniref:4Fe-4S binding protein n=1 Tax=Methanoculleus frigidifontis TaxID=2584085 RepID=A0ABT8M8V2_9EURY|nr:4Fe-4S binding protein [Methanoculleus sp. FWC-SCC1]MDN7024346.1 4Fe-4S binding protein [Methanoculleus sp. FWC-SCC1]
MVVEAVPKVIGLIYAVAATGILIALWRSQRFSRRRVLPVLAVSALFGFVIFTPVAPYQFQLIVLRDMAALGAPLPLAVAGLALFIAVALGFGRVFCSAVCPAGAVQELAFLAPVVKRGRAAGRFSSTVRAGFFLVFLAAGFSLSANLLALLGFRDFFFLAASSVSFFVFLGLVLLSTVVYRPFCRFVCPYGLLLALAAARSRTKIRRTDACINCGKCERVCPVDEAKIGDAKAECYLCGRCTENCPVDGALLYGKEQKEI